MAYLFSRSRASGSTGDSAKSRSQSHVGNNVRPSPLYNVIMTPILFVSFLFSLLLVDLRYSQRRSHAHSQTPSRLPPWLHNIIYRAQPYGGDRDEPGADSAWYYHSKQKKLLEMEAEEAFEVRNSVIALFGVAAIGAAWGAWYVLSRFLPRWMPA